MQPRTNRPKFGITVPAYLPGAYGPPQMNQQLWVRRSSPRREGAAAAARARAALAAGHLIGLFITNMHEQTDRLKNVNDILTADTAENRSLQVALCGAVRGSMSRYPFARPRPRALGR